MVICGPAGSGKSVCHQTLMQAVNSYMNKDEEKSEEMINKEVPLSLPKHKLKVIMKVI